MSYEKRGGRSLAEKKFDLHRDSWKDEMDESVGSSTKELGIYNHKEVIERLRSLHETIPKMKEFEFLQELKEISKDVGVYVVGGSVRDAILQKPAKDIDLVVSKIEPTQLIEILLRFGKVTFDRHPDANFETMSADEIQKLVQNSFGTIKFSPPDSSLSDQIDISFPRTDDYSGSGQSGISGIKRDVDPKTDPGLNIVESLKRRDLTINAMAVNLIDGEIVDPFDGIDDIIKHKVRTVGKPEDRILKEDLSRGFRAIRFACVLSSDIDGETKKVIKEIFRPASQTAESIYQDKPEILDQVKQYEKEIRAQFGFPEGPLPKCLQVFWDRVQKKPRMAVAKEVMSKEILKAIKTNPKRFVELMDEVGGLEVTLPELTDLKNLAQPREFHREGDAFRHTLMLLDHLPPNASLRLILATLFHDLGKTDTQKINEDGKITFHGHEKKSAEHTRAIANRFRFTDKLKKEVVWLVENHMFCLSSDISKIKLAKLERMFLEDEELGNDLISLSRADALASISESGKPNLESVNLLTERLEHIKQLNLDKEKVIPHLVTGKDLVDLGLKPGPDFARILEEIREAQLDGKIETKEEGIELAKKYIK